MGPRERTYGRMKLLVKHYYKRFVNIIYTNIQKRFISRQNEWHFLIAELDELMIIVQFYFFFNVITMLVCISC